MSDPVALAGKVALITGGSQGQGAAEGRLFAAQGATVVLADVVDGPGREVAEEVGGRYLHLDVRSEEQWDVVVADVTATHGRIDVLVNNAGIFRAAALTEETLEQWDELVAVNQTGVFLGTRAAARAMIKAGNGGSIINISSVAGLSGIAGVTSYSATKWAVRGMTKVAAKELGRYGIRVNSVHPGLIATGMTAQFPNLVDEERRRRTERHTPLGRIGVPEDVAGVALFLACDLSGYCTGQEFVVDGGIHG